MRCSITFRGLRIFCETVSPRNARSYPRKLQMDHTPQHEAKCTESDVGKCAWPWTHWHLETICQHYSTGSKSNDKGNLTKPKTCTEGHGQLNKAAVLRMGKGFTNYTCSTEPISKWRTHILTSIRKPCLNFKKQL